MIRSMLYLSNSTPAEIDRACMRQDKEVHKGVGRLEIAI